MNNNNISSELPTSYPWINPSNMNANANINQTTTATTGQIPGVKFNFPPYPATTVPPEQKFTFNIVIFADGKSLGNQSDDLAEKIGKAVAAAMTMRDAQGMIEELGE